MTEGLLDNTHNYDIHGSDNQKVKKMLVLLFRPFFMQLDGLFIFSEATMECRGGMSTLVTNPRDALGGSVTTRIQVHHNGHIVFRIRRTLRYGTVLETVESLNLQKEHELILSDEKETC
jgi:hypothetical protein